MPERDRALRLLAAGTVLAALVGALGWAFEGVRLGRTETEAVARVTREVRARVEQVQAEARAIADALVARVADPAAPEADGGRLREVFASLDDVLARHTTVEWSATVYGPSGVPLAWGGRPSEIPLEHLSGTEAVFVVPAPLGLRLVLVRPLAASGAWGPASPPRRTGWVAVEGTLSPATGLGPLTGDAFPFRTSLVDVALRPSGDASLVTVVLPPGRMSAVRRAWRRAVAGAVGVVVALTGLLLVGPVLDRRARLRRAGLYLGWTAFAVGLVWAARLLVYVSTPPAWTTTALFGSGPLRPRLPGLLGRSPWDLLFTSLALVGALALLAPAVGRLRVALRGRRWPSRFWGRWIVQIAAAGVAAVALASEQELLRRIIEATRLDTLRVSLHPWEAPRLALIGGLVFTQVAALWAATLTLIAAAAFQAPSRRGRLRLGLVWLACAAVAAVGCRAGQDISDVALALGIGTAVGAALGARPALAWYRHATQATRLLALFVPVFLPAAVFYPAVFHHTDAATRRLIDREFAAQAAAHPETLQRRLQESLRQIDGVAGLAGLLGSPVGAGPPPTEPAFRLWSQTALAEARLTSAVELYGADGRLVSRFALNLPEYTALAQHYEAQACSWEIFGETVPFGSEERRVLHADRRVCDSQGRSSGSIVVHVMLDYRTLPFLTAQGPYQQVLRSAPVGAHEATRGADVEVVVYGWGLLPLYASGAGAWPIDETLFGRLYDASRRPFWTDLRKGGVLYHVHFSNDQYGIYAIGYPALTVLDHLERLAGLVTLAGLAYVGLLLGGAVFWRVARDRVRSGAQWLREIRASFYRKLFLAFVLASAVPVVTLAFVVREYFAAKLRADAEGEAVRAAAVARRVIEEFSALQRGGGPPVPPSDDVMVLISQLIDQDVHIFEGARVVATSERDLFASGLLPQRTPAEIYRTIQLDRLPSYVGEDRLGGVRYLMAAAPVGAGGRPAILAVPFALRQREIEKEIDELNRAIHLAALLFILLGAAIGLWMAERIADPVRRLTRATRRIARGDFDARILVRSTDELQRLVDAFNAMAGELKAQAAQLERTHRLEAWAEMARQVAHEIKNPLTPIQLSAEHLRRIHADRGAPLAPVFDSCIETILRQVALLRQIASEFSAFASPPAPRPAPVQVAEIVEDVLQPYRTGLADRIAVEVALAPDLPILRVDRTLLARALVNVVENALHAMPGRGVLRVSAAPDAGGVRITVTDTGVGMDADALARAFEPYFSTKTSGTGLGLPIAKRNVESHGGTIAIESAPGRGTTVTLWLPGAAADA